MIYRLLGAVSVFVGAIFGLIALAVLIPFLNSFSGSLLILIAVFGILAWVFLAIGWQLLRPPKRRAVPERAEKDAEERTVAAAAAEGASGTASANGGARAEVADEEIDVVMGSSFGSFDVVAPGGGGEVPGVDEGPVYPDIAGLSIDERLTAEPVSFKKPYQGSAEDEEADT